MPITVTLELRFKPESVAAGRELMGRALQDTRAFDGNVRTDVLIDEDDEGHWLTTNCGSRWTTTRPTAVSVPAKASSPSFLRCWPHLRSRRGTTTLTSSATPPGVMA